MEHVTLWVHAVLVAAQTGWLVLGAVENVRAPSANGDLVAEVLAMKQMKEEFPELYAVLGRNRIEHKRAQRLAFGAIVLAECLVAALMVVGTVMLTGAALGLVPVEPARIVGTLAVLGFTAIWSAFLVGGQWVHYWAGYEGAQHTHFALATWGCVVLGVLTL